MKACASLSAVESTGAVENSGIVFVDGVPEERLLVRDYRAVGSLDRRTCKVGVAINKTGRASFLRRLSESKITIAVPNRLVDNQVRWVVLVHGGVLSEDVKVAGDADEYVLDFVDSWSTSLDQKLSAVWRQGSSGLILDQEGSAAFRVGPRANRSVGQQPIGGELVYVLQDGGQPWTVLTALASVNAFAGLGLYLGMVPHEIGALVLSDSVSLRGSVGQALSQILEPHGLVVQRELLRESNRVIERRAVHPGDRGRVIRLGWAGAGRAWGHVVDMEAVRREEPSRQWIARAQGWRVESTFELVHGWASSLEGQPDSAYSKTDSADFSTSANVFRLWVLNEDGRYSEEPYSQGPAFDLEGLFGQAQMRSRPLRFLPNLTLDDTGSGRPPVVEFSTDSGVNWKIYPGLVQIRSDRAAVYLNDAVLEAEFLSAAQAGQARVRVTASLQSPEPVQVVRWSGNPFMETHPAEVLNTGDTFRFGRVEPKSIHHAGVIGGLLEADQADDTIAINQWLINQMLLASVSESGQRRVSLTLVGAWPWLRIGDQLVNAGGAGIDGNGQAEAVTGRRGRIGSLRCRWSDGRAVGSGKHGRIAGCVPSTVVDLIY